MTRRGALLILALVAGLSGCGGGSDDEAPSSAQDRFFGIAPVEVPTSADFTRMAAGGIGSYRVVLGWPAIEATQGTYNWAGIDVIVGELARNGMEPLPAAIGTPSFYAPEARIPPTSSDEALDAWSKFLEAAAERYGPGGAFWEEFAQSDPDVAPQPMRLWEIWNEPNSSLFWEPRPDPDEYARLLERSAEALQEVDPEAEIMTGGIFATPQSDGAIVSYDFLDQLYDVEGAAGLIDVVGIHPYGPTVESVIEQLDRTRKAIDESGDDASLYVTELGWGSDPKVPNDLAKSPSQQAKLLSESLTTMSEQRERWDLDGAVWFTWRDSSDGPVGECLWCATAGLVDPDRDSKPSWLAFTELTGGEP